MGSWFGTIDVGAGVASFGLSTVGVVLSSGSWTPGSFLSSIGLSAAFFALYRLSPAPVPPDPAGTLDNRALDNRASDKRASDNGADIGGATTTAVDSGTMGAVSSVEGPAGATVFASIVRISDG